MSGVCKLWLVSCLASALLAACGDDGDGAEPFADAGVPGQDAGSGPLRELEDEWRFQLVPAAAAAVGDKTICDVMIGASGFDISCRPADQVLPLAVGDGCQQLLDDLHLSGSFFDRLEGAFDRRVEYNGEGCASLGFTTGAPYPLPVFATMLAEHHEARPVGAFLAGLGGRWEWRRIVGRADEVGHRCDVDLDVSLAASVEVTIDCAVSAATEVVTGCEAQSFLVVHATLTPVSLFGEVESALRHTGAGCGTTYPAETLTPEGTLAAERL
jgi:hypothetical protein